MANALPWRRSNERRFSFCTALGALASGEILPQGNCIFIVTVHISGGVGALVTAMAQHALGRHGGRRHRIVGHLYVTSVTISGLAGMMMALVCPIMRGHRTVGQTKQHREDREREQPDPARKQAHDQRRTAYARPD